MHSKYNTTQSPPGQNQNVVVSNSAGAPQDTTNKPQNTDTNTAATNTAPTTQSTFGNNQKLGQTQSISKSGGGSNTQDTVTNTMQNLNNSPHNSAAIQDNSLGLQPIQHQPTITNTPGLPQAILSQSIWANDPTVNPRRPNDQLN